MVSGSSPLLGISHVFVQQFSKNQLLIDNTRKQHIKQCGAGEARLAHNQEVGGSKPSIANSDNSTVEEKTHILSYSNSQTSIIMKQMIIAKPLLAHLAQLVRASVL